MTRISFPLCLIWTGCLILSTIAAGENAAQIGCAVVVLISATTYMKSLRPVLLTAALLLPFAIPLLLIHTLFNPGFPVDSSLAGIPIRTSGTAYAASVSARLFGIVCVGVIWRFVSADALIDTLIRWRFPTWFLVFTTQSISLMSLIRQRATTVALAQQARGVPIRGSLFQRVRAIPRLFLPLTLRILSEADDRALILSTRGCGTGPISIMKVHTLGYHDWTIALVSVVIWSLAFFLTTT